MPISLKKMKATHWFLGAAFDAGGRKGFVLLDGHLYTFAESVDPATQNRFLRSVEAEVMTPAAQVGSIIRLAQPVRVVFKHYEDRSRKILEVVNPEIDLPIVRVGTQVSADSIHSAFVFEYDPSCLPDTVRIAGPQGAQGTSDAGPAVAPDEVDGGLPPDDPEEG